MEKKSHMDAIGAAALIAFALHLGFNQVVIKVTNGGFGPVFSAGLRSAGAVVVLLIWMRFRGISFAVPRADDETRLDDVGDARRGDLRS